MTEQNEFAIARLIQDLLDAVKRRAQATGAVLQEWVNLRQFASRQQPKSLRETQILARELVGFAENVSRLVSQLPQREDDGRAQTTPDQADNAHADHGQIENQGAMAIDDAMALLCSIGRTLATQDGADDPNGPFHATADPIYMVEVTRRVYGVDVSHYDPDGYETNDDGKDVPYVECRELVQGAVSLTRRGIDAFLESNRHNLLNPGVYVASLWRVDEMIALRQALMALARNPALCPECHNGAPGHKPDCSRAGDP